jgi:hypothetical protein
MRHACPYIRGHFIVCEPRFEPAEGLLGWCQCTILCLQQKARCAGVCERLLREHYVFVFQDQEDTTKRRYFRLRAPVSSKISVTLTTAQLTRG